MNYEQKYKEALKTARKINNGDGVAAPKGWNTLEVIFPELKESEYKEKPNGEIVLEDFNGSNGFYKINLAHLNKEQVEEVKSIVQKWNLELIELEHERIKRCIKMCLTDATEQRFEEFNTTLRNCLNWLEKQGNDKSVEQVFRPLAGCDINEAAKQAVEKQRLGKNIVFAFNGVYIPVEGKTADDIVNEYYFLLKEYRSATH